MANSSLPIFRLFPTSVSTCLRHDAGITSGSLYPLDFIHCRFEIVVLSPDKDILPFRTSLVDVSFFTIGRAKAQSQFHTP